METNAQSDLKYPNPDKFVFNRNNDIKGRLYMNGYPNILSNCNVGINGKNMAFKGKPKIFTRHGESEFGEELVFSFLIEKPITEYKINSKHNVLEFYLPKDKGIQFLKEYIAFLEAKE
jgi:hypothetical protein